MTHGERHASIVLSQGAKRHCKIEASRCPACNAEVSG
jgi:uncharacterized protein with PIN domain